VILFTIALFSFAQAATARDTVTWQWRYRAWMPQHWIRLAYCESGTRPPADPNWRHRSGSYAGAFGFYDGSWLAFRLPGYPSRADLANPFQQWTVARRIAARYGIASPWGCWRGPQHAWVRGSLPERNTYR
jgi:hypothetical protein